MDSFAKTMLERVQRRQETISRKLEQVGKIKAMDNVSKDSSSSADEDSDCEISEIPSSDAKGCQSNEQCQQDSNPKPYRSRLAALAENINNWEDDLSRPQIKSREAVKQSSKPPVTNASETATASLILKKGVTGTIKVAGNTARREIRRSSSTTDAPPPKSRFMQPSLTTGKSHSLRTNASPLASSNSSEKDLPVVNTETESDADSALTGLLLSSSKSTSTRNKTSQNSAGSKSAAVLGQEERRTSVSRAGSTGRRSSINEPTKQPVAARLAAWKQKSKELEKNATQGRTLALQKPTRRQLGKIEEAAEKENLKENAVRLAGNAAVNSKKSCVANHEAQAGISQAGLFSATQPKTVSASSPKKLGQATLNIQEKLSQMCENWKQSNISEKSRQERTAEIQAVANRWKNGILVDNGNTSEDEPSVKTKNPSISISNPEMQKLPSAASMAPPADLLTTCPIPPPPPLPPPPPFSSGFSAKKVVTSVQLQPPATATAFSKDFGVRRAVKFNSCPKPFVKPWDTPTVDSGEKQNLSKEEDTDDAVEPVCDKVSNEVAANFESNLIAMGYQVSPEGSAAVIDLKVFKEPDPPKPVASRACPTPSAVKKVKATGRTVTAARFDNQEKAAVIKRKVATLPIASSLRKATGAPTEQVKSGKTAGGPSRVASVSGGRSGNLYSLIKAQARQALEVKAPVEVPSASSKVESVDSPDDSFESSASSSGVDSPSSHHQPEQKPTKEPVCSSSKFSREPVLTSKWDSGSDSNSQYSDNNTAEKFRRGPKTKRCANDRLTAGDQTTDTDDTYSGMDEPELRSRSSASTLTKRLTEEGVYMEMTQPQPASSMRQASGQSSSKGRSSAKNRRVQFLSDIDATTYTASDTDDGMSSSSSRCPPSCDDTYDVIWDSESSSNCFEAPSVPAVSRQRAETLPDLPRRNLTPGHSKDRPVTIAGHPQVRPLEHRADTRHQMAAFFERRYQQRRPACRSENDRFKSPSLPHKSARHRLKSLQEMVNQEEKILVQASNALEVCSRGMSSFVGTSEAVECHRVLLVSSRKREALLMEMKRVREGLPSSEPTGLTGRLAAADIRLPLKPEFIAKIGTVQDASIHYFVMLLRSGVNVAVAQTVSTLEPMVLGSLEARSRLQLSGMPQIFSADLEIYAMVVPRDQKVNTPKKSKHAATQLELLTPKSSRKVKPAPSNMPSIRTSNFVQIASLELTDRTLNKTHFALDGVAYACPLQGTIHLRLRHVMEAFIHQRGFLNICSEDSGVWNRRWCTLNSNEILCWKHPNDELTKEPVMTVDLRSCITGKVVAVALGDQPEATSVEIVTVKDSRGGSGACYSDNILPTRHWLIADSIEECQEWTSKFNQVLSDLRAWHPYANPSVRLPSEDTPLY